MTLPEIYEHLGSLPSGGYMTVDSRFDKGYMYKCIHMARAFIVCERWKQYSNIPPVYYQRFKPKYEVLSQTADLCYARYYNVPDIIALDGRASGLGFVGGNGTLCQFREVSSKGAFAAMQKDRVMKAGRKAYALVLGGGEVDVYYKDVIKDMELWAVFSDPTKVPLYNETLDQYPMDVSDIPKMETYLMQGSMGLVYKTPMDRVNNQLDSTANPPVR